MNGIWNKIKGEIGDFYITLSRGGAEISKDREISVPERREININSIEHPAGDKADLVFSQVGESKIAERCPYCQSKNFVKRGLRRNKYQTVQLYLCQNLECGRTSPPRL